MKKLTLTQWITLGFTIIAFVITKLEALGFTAKTIATIVEIVGIIKFVYDTYIGFTTENVVDFHNYAQTKPQYRAKGVKKVSTAQKLEDFIKSQK